jgi:hypothetical protein
MGWLDRLLGREEKAPEAPAAPEEPVTTPPSAPVETAPPPSAADMEEGASAARDEALETENRIPPGSG